MSNVAPNKTLLNDQQYKIISKSLLLQLNLSKIDITAESIENNTKHQKRNQINKT